ncbi:MULTISPECIES: restriction endonuclease subunit S [Acinetobacter]|uniref:restriction endonuclease subunit S n=1 Tax=Acinetobacter TaxID=469 RepID=UPI0015D443D1|nr:restriction endonuclease subunit S [Acinetobacter sp. YH12147]
MFAYSLKKSELTAKRLDPKFYSPEQIVNEKKLSALFSEPLESLRIEDAPIVYGILKPEGTSEGLYRVAKAEKFQGMFVDSDDCDEVSKTVYESFKRSVAKTGDVLIAIGGYVGRPAILNVKSGANCNINRHISRVRVDSSKIDPYYLVVFLSSRHGQKRLERQITGSVQAGINLEDLREVHVSLFEKATQKYIGDKVRQAEQLRAWAKRLRASVDDKLNSLNLPINEPPQLLNRVSVQTMEDRLDPRPYRSHYLHLVNEIEKLPHDSINSLVGLASGCPVSSKDFLDNAGIPLVRIRNIGFDDFVGLDTGVSKDVYQDASKYQAKEKMIVVGMDGIFRSQFFVADELPMLVNQRVAMLVPQKIRGELLTHWLNRPEGQMQLNQWAVKTTVEHTSLSDIGRVLVPRLEESLESKLADDLLNARLAYRYAKFLTQAAKTLVEALIEGQLTEQQLIQAHQALGDGDNSLDQAILSKLSDEGYAVEGAKPLFSDIDELYRLLGSAAQAAAEE